MNPVRTEGNRLYDRRMAELLKGDAVFIHVPKCGGTWVREALKAQGLHRDRIGTKHATPAHVNDVWRHHRRQFLKHWPLHPWVTPGRLRRAFKFAFVRHPLRWYESWWRFMAGRWQPWEVGRWHPQRPIDDCGDDDFDRFVAKVLERRPGYVSEMFGWYADGADYVGCTETLADDLVGALTRAGLSFDEKALRAFPPVNVSEGRRPRPTWDRSLRRRVLEAEAPALERFGYGSDPDEGPLG